jgi:hypothetical protein
MNAPSSEAGFDRPLHPEQGRHDPDGVMRDLSAILLKTFPLAK